MIVELFKNREGFTVQPGTAQDQHAFFIVVYVYGHETVGVTTAQLIEERLKLQEEQIVKLCEGKKATVFLHGEFQEEDQGMWTMYYQHLSISVKDSKARYSVTKVNANTFQLKELARLV